MSDTTFASIDASSLVAVNGGFVPPRPKAQTESQSVVSGCLQGGIWTGSLVGLARGNLRSAFAGAVLGVSATP